MISAAALCPCLENSRDSNHSSVNFGGIVEKRSIALQSEWEMWNTWGAKSLNNLRPGRPCMSPAHWPPHSLPHAYKLFGITRLVFSEGKPRRWSGIWCDDLLLLVLISFQGLINAPCLDSYRRATPWVNGPDADAYFWGMFSCTCYKDLTECWGSGPHTFSSGFWPWQTFTRCSYKPASRLCLTWEGDVHNLLYMYYLESKI